MARHQSQSRMKVWITKYALTKGIEQIDVEISDDGYAYSIGRWRTQYPPGDWHRTEAAAIKRADEMRLVRIASLEKQITKLKALCFDKTPT